MPMGCLDLPHRMLRNQRKSLAIKQLKRGLVHQGLVGGSGGGGGGNAARPDSPSSEAEASCVAELRGVLSSLLKRLDLDQLELLNHAVQTRGMEKTACVLIDKDVALWKTSADVCRFCCQAWRWPDLDDSAELKRLPCCSAPNKSSVCINPYHRSRVLSEGLPDSGDCWRWAGGYSNSTASGVRKPTASCTETVSTASDGCCRTSWCRLAYWELRHRVGPLFPVYDDTVDVFHDTPEHGGSGGLSLQALQQQAKCPDGSASGESAGSRERVRRVRSKIGLGVTLHRENGADDAESSRDGNGGVWLYNRSDVPVFVSSCLLGGGSSSSGAALLSPGTRGWRAHRLPPGYCAKVYERESVENTASAFRGVLADLGGGGSAEDGPVDFHSIHVSFAKGWGPGYSRQSVTGCACWLEILIDTNR